MEMKMCTYTIENRQAIGAIWLPDIMWVIVFIQTERILKTYVYVGHRGSINYMGYESGRDYIGQRGNSEIIEAMQFLVIIQVIEVMQVYGVHRLCLLVDCETTQTS